MTVHQSEPVQLTTDEVASLLRTSRKAVYCMTERGQLPGVIRIGRRVLYRRRDLVDYLDRKCASSPKENRR
jgi:excisionase family DNA binding protein